MTSVTAEVVDLCRIILSSGDGKGDLGENIKREGDGMYSIRFKVPGQGYHWTTIEDHQALEIVEGKMLHTDYS
jgi:hypothetical protein